MLKRLIGRRFSVYVGGEFERVTGFLGLMKLLATYSDFFSYTPAEQRTEIKKWISSNNIYVDAVICVKVSV